MIVEQTEIPDVLLLKPKVFEDDRGFFMETWNKRTFAELGINHDFVQDNHSRSVKNTLRGIHYQIENPQGKLVRVTQGEVFDVAVDLRKSSPTFGKWFSQILSAKNKKMLWVPPGFGHAFLVLSETSEFQYKCTDFYNSDAERCIIWNDMQLKIDWPISEEKELIISSKDIGGKAFSDADYFYFENSKIND
ncbi:MAG: dTDP-4-dehydrorhamnose 3,5-epimerase [Candidatus Riflebacteria bacterium]